MKGKSMFTQDEISELKKLITLRLKSELSKQKGIRDKMRRIGFYGKDDWGITGKKLSDLDFLIASGRIQVIGGNKSVQVKSSNAEKPLKTSPEAPISFKELKAVLNTFRLNQFDPLSDRSSILPDYPGNYLVCLRQGAAIPSPLIKPEFTLFNELQVLYTGIAGTSLRNRDYKTHFNGSAGRSTLRKSIGVLFGFQLKPRDSDPTTGKTKFSVSDEADLTAWMRANLLLYFYVTSHFDQIETFLIKHFNPPLNLRQCYSEINREFRAMLSMRRSKQLSIT